MELVCRDGGTPSLSTTATIVVSVSDVNDHAPRVASDVIGVSLVENNRARTVLTTVNATDDDAGPNARLRYALAPLDADADTGALLIDPVTGVVSTNRTFDFERGPNDLRYLVTVTDGASAACPVSSRPKY